MRISIVKRWKIAGNVETKPAHGASAEDQHKLRQDQVACLEKWNKV